MFLGNELAVQGTVQAYSIPSDWQAYPQAIESNNFPRAVSAIGLAASFGLKAIVDAILYKGSSCSLTV